jgi:putative DNA primase/helicase
MVHPGCKADAAVVIIGAQGVGKSTLGRIIGGERYGEASLALIGTRDWFAELRGKIIVEISELAGHNRAELETIKAVLSRQVDEYRPAYARAAQSVPRGCVFYGTTNERDFLIDASGNRRWLPIESNGPIALDVAEGMRAQCFAEAFDIVRTQQAGAFWMIPDALDQQADHVVRDPWSDILDEKLRDLSGALPAQVENTRIYDVLKIPADRQSGGGTGRRIAAVMIRMGYTRDLWRTGSRVVRGFVLPAEPEVKND